MKFELLEKLADEMENYEEEDEKKKAQPGEEEPASKEEGEDAEEMGQEQGAASGTVDPIAVMNFFSSQGKISDADFHSFCEQNGFNIHEAESLAYGLAQKLMQFIRGGKGANLDPNTVDPRQLEWGIQIEAEHTDCPSIQKKIALDHIAEDPQYYSMPYMQEELQREQGGGEEVSPKLAALLLKAATCGKSHIKKKSTIIKPRGKK